MFNKKLIVVDDSAIDREMLKNILGEYFEVDDAENGYVLLDKLLNSKVRFDAILLDISMPVLDAFDVLDLMKKKGLDNIHIFLITAEATKLNVLKAANYKVTDFIGKPFDAEVVLDKISSYFGLTIDGSVKMPKDMLTPEVLTATYKYLDRLKGIFDGYLENQGLSNDHYEMVTKLVKIFLEEIAAEGKDYKLDANRIDIISKACYVYDIGLVSIPDKILENDNDIMNRTDRVTYESHTEAGAEIVKLNRLPFCQYIDDVCEDICMHHHERFDGLGYPNGLKGKDNSRYSLLCSMAVRFDKIFSERPSFDDAQFYFTLKELQIDRGAFGMENIALLERCREQIIVLYNRRANNREDTTSIFENI